MTHISKDNTELQAWATDETTALINRFSTVRSAGVLSGVTPVRKALEAAAHSIESALTAPAESHDDIRTFVEQLAARAGIDDLRAELHERDAVHQRQSALLKAAEADLEAARDELKAERARAEATHNEAEVLLRDAKSRLDTAHTELKAERARTDAVRAEAKASDGSAMVKEAQAKLEAASRELQAERARTEALRAEAAQASTEFERALDELRREHVTVVEEQALACTSLPLDGLLTVFTTLKKAATLPDVINGLMDGIAREFSRVALFEVKGKRLRGARQLGFDFENDIRKVAIPFVADSLLVRTITTGRIESFFADAQNDAAIVLPFGGAPACALAIPIMVQGATVAVIYADDSDKAEFTQAAPKARFKFAELLHQHAQLVLLKIWVDQKGRAELREFVNSLADRMEEEYRAAAEVGRNRLQCQQFLKEELERSRRLYAQRIAREDPAAVASLDDYLLEIARAKGDTGFAQDLSVLLQASDRARTPIAMNI